MNRAQLCVVDSGDDERESGGAAHAAGREILARVAELQGDVPKPELAVAEALRREYPASLAAAATA